MTATLERPGSAHTRQQAGHLVGTRHLVRLALRRDRIVLPVWIVVIGMLASAGAGSYEAIYPTQAERDALTASMGSNPSLTLLYGPAFDLSTAGGFTAWRFGAFLALFTALACIFTVTRHTRQEEDTGRHELLASAVVGRYAALTAGVLVAGLGALATGVLITVSLAGVGMPVAGSVALGAGTALTGFAFTGVAAIAAQISEYSRGANGIAAAVLGATFLLRAVGDAAADASWLSWLSPFGWATQVRAFADERWWVLGLLVLAALVTGLVGYLLLPRRDVGMGLIQAKPGPARAAHGLRSPFALAWRLHRGALLGWIIGFAVFGALFGSLAAGVGDVIGDSAEAQEMFARLGGSQSMVDAFLASMAGIMAMIASLYVVQATVRMRSEETALRVEPLLATSVSRLSWAASHLVFPLLGSAALLAVAGFATGLLHGLRVDDLGGQLPAVLGAAMAQLPAVWVVAGAATALFGLLPKLATAAWAVAAVFLLISMFGPIANAGQLVLDLSPFQHIPKLPSAEFTATPLVWLSALALVLLGIGLAGFRRRDIG
ncbi:ABC transporter permease [Prauserella cavernicola]|uniref:ABC transporter permease n=1 Tax=Prauserella cavernicola TaxID=2800127 RepID=A0A934V428_9PSEU|nr:ABC transporter permease [Prauserella cavernicola]MBK1784977.1 ABC transporter permease [Prauserella cavernicola]